LIAAAAIQHSIIFIFEQRDMPAAFALGHDDAAKNRPREMLPPGPILGPGKRPHPPISIGRPIDRTDIGNRGAERDGQSAPWRLIVLILVTVIRHVRIFAGDVVAHAQNFRIISIAWRFR
jgi:hypothetical protein